MSTSLPKWEEEIRNAGSTEACLREAIRQIKGLNDMRPHDGLGYEINDVIEVANSIKGKNGNAAAHAMTLDEAIAHAEDVAGKCDTSCKREHRQLADWLKELREMRAKPIGNAAAMREALEAALRFIGNLEIEPCSPLDEDASELRQRIMDALSAPPRNCDIYPTNEDAWRSYQLSHAKNADAYVEATVPDFIDWLFAPSEKGAEA